MLLSRYHFLLILSLLTVFSSSGQLQRFRFSANKMGSPFNLVFYCSDSSRALSLSKQCFALVDSLNAVFSDYDSTSELSRICQSPGVQSVSPRMMDLTMQAANAFRQSKGSFDITVGALSRLWRKARKEKRFPDSMEVIHARSYAGMNRIRLNKKDHTLSMPAGTRLDFGGIAKGYSAQLVIDFLQTQGIQHALADAGGDMVMSDAPPGSKGWMVGVNVPETTDELLPRKLQLANMAVATSGDAYQYMEHNGKKYSHIIDPRTGYGISSQRNVTVIAANGTDADWLATACSILPVEEAKKIAQKMHAELMITELENDIVIYHKTKGFDRYWKQ